MSPPEGPSEPVIREEPELMSPSEQRHPGPVHPLPEQTPDSTVRRSRPVGFATPSYGTIGGDGATDRRGSIAEPTTPSRPRMPMRRSSSKYQKPHRGQEFSADDDLDEIESDAERVKKPPVTPNLRRQSSVARRRAGTLPKIDSAEEEEDADADNSGGPGASQDPSPPDEVEGDQTMATADEDEDAEDELSDAESFTLRDKQAAINNTHPFGIRIWKPALYKKKRGVEKIAEGDIHSAPGGRVSNWIWFFNVVWTLIFGWWLAAAAFVAGFICLLFAFGPDDRGYAQALFGLAGYIFYPFGIRQACTRRGICR